jgi:hypothetical protein
MSLTTTAGGGIGASLSPEERRRVPPDLRKERRTQCDSSAEAGEKRWVIGEHRAILEDWNKKGAAPRRAMAANGKAEKKRRRGKRKKSVRTPESHGAGASRVRMTLATASPTRNADF